MKLGAVTGQDDLKTESFGIVSRWKYAGLDMGVFQCEESFATPEFVSFLDGSRKLHNQTFLFKSNDD